MSAVNAVALLAAAGGDYQISRSVRLRSSASASFTRTPSSAGNRKTWTWSGWVKRGALGSNSALFGNFFSANDFSQFYISFNTSNQLQVGLYTTVELVTAAVYRDASAWYHIVCLFDTTQATSTNRLRLFVNGAEVTSFATDNRSGLTQNADFAINAAQATYLGFNNVSGYYFDGYLTEVNFIDGQALTPSSFGETDSLTGVWKPKKYAGTYGTNGFYLNFSDNSAATAAAIGKDSSGNGNNWTPNNISVTAGVTYDSMIDVPTMGDGGSNFCVWNPLSKGASVGLTNGNLDALGTVNTNSGNCVQGTIAVSSGKWYAEFKVTNTYSYSYLGVVDVAAPGTYPGQLSSGYGLEVGTGATYNVSAGPSVTGASAGDTIMVALDMDSGKLWWGKNGTWGGSGNPSAGTGQQYSSLTGIKTFGLSAYSSSGTFNANFGQHPFAYTPPTGFKALNTQNLPDATIKKGKDYFDIALWTGNGVNNRAISTNFNFSPDFVWAKSRSNSSWWHVLGDTVRGIGNLLSSNSTGAETASVSSIAGYISALSAASFTATQGSSSIGNYNANGDTYVSWNWKESATAGFDIVTHTGTGGGAVRTVSHNLGVVPSMIITKCRGTAVLGTDSWVAYFKGFAVNDYIFLNTTGAKGSSANYLPALPTSTVFSVGGTSANVSNESGLNYVSYLFAEVAGYSKFGIYTANGSADGPFVYCGFRPRFVMIKWTNVESWYIFDTARGTYNVIGPYMVPNTSAAEGTYTAIDILSNGFKVRDTNNFVNSSGTYIYAAFAENPFKNSLAR